MKSTALLVVLCVFFSYVSFYNVIIGWRHWMILMLSQFSQTSLVATRDLNLNKTLSNSNFNNDESINGNTIIQNLGELYWAGNIFDSNWEDDFIIDKKPQITNGVIFSKIWSSKDKYLPHGKTEDNFKAKGDSANENKR